MTQVKLRYLTAVDLPIRIHPFSKLTSSFTDRMNSILKFKRILALYANLSAKILTEMAVALNCSQMSKLLESGGQCGGYIRPCLRLVILCILSVPVYLYCMRSLSYSDDQFSAQVNDLWSRSEQGEEREATVSFSKIKGSRLVTVI